MKALKKLKESLKYKLWYYESETFRDMVFNINVLTITTILMASSYFMSNNFKVGIWIVFFTIASIFNTVIIMKIIIDMSLLKSSLKMNIISFLKLFFKRKRISSKFIEDNFKEMYEFFKNKNMENAFKDYMLAVEIKGEVKYDTMHSLYMTLKKELEINNFNIEENFESKFLLLKEKNGIREDSCDLIDKNGEVKSDVKSLVFFNKN